MVPDTCYDSVCTCRSDRAHHGVVVDMKRNMPLLGGQHNVVDVVTRISVAPVK